ncbi:MAG: OmpA family protein [Cytophagales bacterium]
MKKVLFIVMSLISLPFLAQNVQWGFKILEYSSQRKNKEYSAKQALGLPNALPMGVENISAWQPKGNTAEEFIKIGFLTPTKPKQIIIVESFHPGYLSKVLVYDADGRETEIANFAPKSLNFQSRILQINTSSINYFVFAVKLVFITPKDSTFAIDAVGLSESNKPYKTKIDPNAIVKASMVAVKLDSNINSTYPEIGPLVSPNGKTLYLSRKAFPANIGGEKDLEDIWYSNWDEKEKKWALAKNIGEPLNNKFPNFINSISPDGNTILLGNSYLPDGQMDEGVSTSKRRSTGWTAPKRLMIEDDENNIGKFANYFMSNGQKILLISNHRKRDTYGDRDLYVSFLKADYTWSKPLNLGKNINTRATEAAPFLASDDKTLYFTSDGRGGYGGSDIYITRRLDDSWVKWSEPENLGPIVNTSGDESYLSVNAAGDNIYFTSQGSNDNDMDIYRLELPGLFQPTPVMLTTGHVIDTKTNAYISDVKILFENLETGKEMGIASSSPDSGKFEIVLPSGSKYGYLAEKEGYISIHSNIDLTKMTAYKENKQDIYLTPTEVGQIAPINNIFFEFGKYQLKKESFLELNRLAALLKNSETFRIEIAGNTDNVGSEAYNDQLSIDRAAAVGYYLLKKSGVSKSKVIMKHNGELKPVASNATAKGRELNRRVQFKILAK